MSSTTANKKIKNADKSAQLIGPMNRVEDNRARDLLISARVSLLINHPFFGNLATRMPLINADEWLATAATDGRNFYYNSRFVNSLRPREVDFLVGHEILHVVYDHMGRCEGRDPQLWNVADDYCVNADLKKHRVGEFITTVPCLYDSKYEGWTAEAVYDDLYKNADKIDLDDLIDKLLDDHMEGNKDDSSGKRPSPLSDSEREKLRQEMRENIINAANQSKAAGKELPDSVARMVKEITEPQMPWREMIQTVLTSAIKTDYTFMRPSRRGWHLDAVLPSQTPGEEIEITVAIDTSGSISTKELQVFLGEIQGIMDSFAGFKINVFCFDTRVHNPQEYTSENLDNIADYEPMGGGGTAFTAIFDHLKLEGSVPNHLVVFTDGRPFGSWGDPDLCDVTWVIHGDPKKTIQPPFGTWAHFTE